VGILGSELNCRGFDGMANVVDTSAGLGVGSNSSAPNLARYGHAGLMLRSTAFDRKQTRSEIKSAAAQRGVRLAPACLADECGVVSDTALKGH